MTSIMRLALDEKDPLKINSAINQLAEYLDRLSAANLSDYAQGAWTPTLAGSTTAGTPTHTVQVGSYEKVGRMVVARFNVQITNKGGMAGNVWVTGLPYTVANVANDGGRMAVTGMGGVTLDAGYAIVTAVASINTARLSLSETGSALTTIFLPVVNIADATFINGMGIYHT